MIPEALSELMRHAFGTLGLTGLWGSCFPDNRASRRVLEKCGFSYLRTETALPVCSPQISRSMAFMRSASGCVLESR